MDKREKEFITEKSMRIACVSMVKNEEELILHNITYHRFIGVTDFFIFLDNSSDDTKNKIEHIPHVHIFENLTYQDLLRYNINKPELDLELIKKYFSTHSGIRQLCNSNMASEICKNAGIDWLIHLDPDELVYIDETRITQDSLKRFLSGLDKRVKAVTFRNIEVVPTKIEVDCVFQDHLFKSYSIDGNIPGLPKSQLLNPFTNSYTPAGWFWGHSSGKLATRPCCDSYFTTSHECYTDGEMIAKEYLLHYNIYSYRQFLNKYRNFSNYPKRRSHGRPVRPLRVLLTNVVNSGSFSDEFLLDYYKKHIMYSEEDIELIRNLARNAFHEIYAVSDFFSKQQNKGVE